MKVGGRIIKPTEKVDSSMLMETSMMATGKTTKPMAMESIVTWTVPDTRVIGKKTSNTVRVLKPGLMVLAITETTSRARNTAVASSPGQMEAPTQDNSMRTI
jgi:hypothetical protein